MPEPWRFSAQGASIAIRVTPRGGRDAVDGVETMADGRSVMKVRVRAIADGGEANKAVTKLLAKALGVPQANVRLSSGTTSRRKQIAVDGDPHALLRALRALAGEAKENARDCDDGKDH